MQMWMVRSIALAALTVIIFSCASMGGVSAPPPRAQRTYSQIAALDLYALIEAELVRESFAISERDYARGYLATNWFEYEGAQHGFVKWKERRMFSVYCDIDRITEKHLLILGMEVQERAPVASEWRQKEVYPESDAQYQRILKKIDDAVKSKGGKCI
jgi:hypothetical protein